MSPKLPKPQKFIHWIGSTPSLVIHSVVFAISLALMFFGVQVEKVLLVLTTAVSLEAIYLAIFIQMTVNSNTQSLQEVEEDIDEIQEDVQGIEKDIDEIQEDVDKLEEDEAEDDLHDVATMKSLGRIQDDLQKLMQDIETLRQQKK